MYNKYFMNNINLPSIQQYNIIVSYIYIYSQLSVSRTTDKSDKFS